MHQSSAVRYILDYKKRRNNTVMKQFEETLSCGVKLQIYQPEEGKTVLLRMTAPEGQPLTNIVQIRDDRITVAIDPSNLPKLATISRKFFGPGSLQEFLKNAWNQWNELSHS